MRRNPFHLLGISADRSAQEIEDAGNALLLRLARGEADVYCTPLGVHARSAEDVRAAMAELRDPRRRQLHALWARLPLDTDGMEAGTCVITDPPPEAATEHAPTGAERSEWTERMAAFGWAAAAEHPGRS